MISHRRPFSNEHPGMNRNGSSAPRTLIPWNTFMVACMLALLAYGTAYAQFASGDVFVGVGSGQIKRYSQTGTLLQTLNSTTGSHEMTGMAFDASGNLYATNFTTSVVSKFDNTGTLVAATWASTNSHGESIVIDGSGNFYTGEADGNRDIRKFNSSGTQQASYNAATGSRGTDWIELGSDLCTMYYTSEGTVIRRFDVCTNTQLTDFTTLPSGAVAFALRIRANGEILVAGGSNVYRLNSSGSVIQTYSMASLGITGESFLFALNLDPDGTSFWTAGYSTGKVRKVDIATGSVLQSWTAGIFASAGGLAIFNEPIVSSCTAPSISDQPDDATICTGEDATFNVTAAGSGTLNYQWRKDGSNLSDLSGHISGANTASLTISDATTADSGDYDVIITGDCDPADTSDAATLTVHPPPTISVSLSPTELWPPNHAMATINATITTTGLCTSCGPLVVQLVSITSSESDNGLGDGDTPNDIQGASYGSNDRQFQLRRERSGSGSGRTYTVTYRVTDCAGNTATWVGYVTCPHNH
jgi:hypothetical protein